MNRFILIIGIVCAIICICALYYRWDYVILEPKVKETIREMVTKGVLKE